MNAKTYSKKTAAFAGYVIQNIPSDLDEATMERWMNNSDGIKKFLSGLKLQEMAMAKPVRLFTSIFRLTVDYSQSLEAMIAAGNYDWKNDDITAKRFPIKGDGIVEFEGRYFHFDRNISSEDTIKEIEAADPKNPWAAAKIEHVLSHGKTFPEEQRKFPIIALGSVAEVRGYRNMPVLGGLGSERGLSLRWFGHDWSPIFRFLAVRKVSVS